MELYIFVLSCPLVLVVFAYLEQGDSCERGGLRGDVGIRSDTLEEEFSFIQTSIIF